MAGLGAGAKLVGGILSARKMRKAYNQQIDSLNRQKREATDLYNRRYNEDATMRSDAQALLNLTNENIRARNAQAAGTSAVMGGTMAAQAATQEANNAALAQTTGAIAAKADARKDAIEQNYVAQKSKLDGAIDAAKMAKAQASAESIQNAANVLGDTAVKLMPTELEEGV